MRWGTLFRSRRRLTGSLAISILLSGCGGVGVAGSAPSATPSSSASPTANPVTLTGIPPGRYTLFDPGPAASPAIGQTTAQATAVAAHSDIFSLNGGKPSQTVLGLQADGKLVWAVVCAPCTYPAPGDGGLPTSSGGTPAPTPAPETWFVDFIDATTGAEIGGAGG